MKTALILPGGGAKGAIELGVCKVILKKIIPDLIIGTSVGALNGVVLANGKDIEENINRLELVWRKASRRNLFPYNLELFYKFHFARSIYSHKGLYRYLKKNVSVRNFKDLEIPLHVNCTNMINGESHLFSKGELFDPIVASCSVPPFFAPVNINDIPYVDGSISSYFGIREAIKKCKQIIIINIRSFEKYLCKKNNLANYVDHASVILTSQLIIDEIEIGKSLKAKIIEVKPVTKNVHLADFRYTNELIKAGEKAGEDVLDKIK